MTDVWSRLRSAVTMVCNMLERDERPVRSEAAEELRLAVAAAAEAHQARDLPRFENWYNGTPAEGSTEHNMRGAWDAAITACSGAFATHAEVPPPAVKKWEDRLKHNPDHESFSAIDVAKNAEIAELRETVARLSALPSPTVYLAEHAKSLLAKLEEMQEGGYTPDWFYFIVTVTNHMSAATGLTVAELTGQLDLAARAPAEPNAAVDAREPGLTVLHLGDPVPMPLHEGMGLLKQALDPRREQLASQAHQREVECRKTCTFCTNEVGGAWPCAKEVARHRALRRQQPIDNTPDQLTGKDK
jgi:hypothetical protein